MGKGGCIMDRMKFWENRNFVLFRIDNDGQPIYQFNLGIFRIMWFGQDCQRVILRGLLPQNWDLFKNEDGPIFDLMCMPALGAPDIYDDGELVARFSNCTVRRKWINRPIALRPDETDHIWGYMELDCDITLMDVDPWEKVR